MEDYNFSDLNLEENKTDSTKPKTKTKEDKKSNRKMAKAISIITFHEKKSAEELFTETISNNIWVYHFGNGDEDDQKGLKDYFSQFSCCKVYVFPGISYGIIIFDDLTKPLPSKSHQVLFATGERQIFTFYTKIQLDQVVQKNDSTFPNANFKVNIRGLHVYDEFLTPEEEQTMIHEIDAQDWKKLSNRRVQHYGYEFIYGANNINKDNKIGTLPSFTDSVMKSKSV